MAPYYERVAAELKWNVDATLLKTLKLANETELKKLDERLEDAQQNLGETDISDALIAKAQYLAKIGEKVPHGFIVRRLLYFLFVSFCI